MARHQPARELAQWQRRDAPGSIHQRQLETRLVPREREGRGDYHGWNVVTVGQALDSN